jgi:hypothetical protein
LEDYPCAHQFGSGPDPGNANCAFESPIGLPSGSTPVIGTGPCSNGTARALELINVQRRKHKDQLSGLGHIGRQLDAELPQAQRDDLWRQRREALDAIGRNSGLDVDGVIATCDKVIAVARKDLKGRYTE